MKTETKTEHTPTPWTIILAESHQETIRGANGHVVARLNHANGGREANAAFVVKAANAHDALVAVISSLHDEMDDRLDDGIGADPCDLNRWLSELRHAISIAKAEKS